MDRPDPGRRLRRPPVGCPARSCPAWWRTNIYGLLLAHYALSLVGVIFDGYFLYLQVFVIGAVCIWCLTYEISLLLRFLIAFFVWYRQPKPDMSDPDR